MYFIPSTSICNLPFVGKLRENLKFDVHLYSPPDFSILVKNEKSGIHPVLFQMYAACTAYCFPLFEIQFQLMKNEINQVAQQFSIGRGRIAYTFRPGVAFANGMDDLHHLYA